MNKIENVIEEVRHITQGNIHIQYTLMTKKVKNINLRIRSDGSVMVSASKNLSASYVDDFVRSKAAFIKKAIDRLEKKQVLNGLESENYGDGEVFLILGQEFVLKVIPQCKKNSVMVDENQLLLYIRDKNEYKNREKLMKSWIRQNQQLVFSKVCDEVYDVFKKYSVHKPLIRIRKMKSRWGSCQPVKGIITLNSKLFQVPLECIEYVVYHEFNHFLHPDHSKSFYDELDILLPGWTKREEMLKQYM
ncbi:hypothetical protein SAMN02745248_00506 [Hathewaya proteolytica DSM 3090]|uniref:YgjP-like metallopeptidase domain-containing protein n=1 Tax=Hathewaya proteolytica DSM 3090 TaxID=1121331 RepID=A0A1M6KKS4_9CLOT|nr:SprT family zinc-dependent metalloprotease [Hathewaya proteolytica]SHJ59564.1 hypothetical protein SAMN02745248_00506 [Hathewaya proteolytica DSM 3090]